MKTIAFHNLGCKVNAYETDVMMQNLQKKGWKIVPFDGKADVYVVNTCSVTNIADRKSRQMLHRAKKENPEAVVVAVGCYVETGREAVEKDPAVDLAVGTGRKGSLAEILEDYLRERENSGSSGDFRTREDAGNSEDAGDSEDPGSAKTLDGRTFSNITDHPVYEEMTLEVPGRTRADIKIQDGCNQFCSYCIIPYARGRVRSRKPEDVLREVRALAAEGVKEVVVTGIHIGSYGTDFRGVAYNDTEGGNPDLQRLLHAIAEVPGIERIRLGSLEPRVMNEEFVAAIASEPKICPHFHLSLQSGCDSVLKRMNRHYTAEEFLETAKRLRRYYDRPALTTDVIVGFPGETEEEFEESLRFLETVNFYEIHVFKYSRRHGTAADRMPDQITEAVKEERSHILQELTMKQAAAFRESFRGEKESILAEEMHSYEEMRGRTQMAYGKDAGEDAGIQEKNGAEWIVGHTARYIEAAVPAEGTKIRRGQVLTGIIGPAIPGTTVRLLKVFTNIADRIKMK